MSVYIGYRLACDPLPLFSLPPLGDLGARLRPVQAGSVYASPCTTGLAHILPIEVGPCADLNKITILLRSLKPCNRCAR